MSKIIIYMNEQLKEKNPTGPVMTVKEGKKIKHTNRINLATTFRTAVWENPDGSLSVRGPTITVRYDPNFCSDVPTHEIKSWIEIV